MFIGGACAGRTIVDQTTMAMNELRCKDPNHYLNNKDGLYSVSDLELIKSFSLADVILNTTSLDCVPTEAFKVLFIICLFYYYLLFVLLLLLFVCFRYLVHQTEEDVKA